MNWEAIAAIGQALGAAAVVVSLAYLAMQIRQNTRQLQEQNLTNRLSALTSVGNRFTAFRCQVAADSEVASLWSKGSQDLASLSREERYRFDLICVDLFWAWAIPWLYTDQGALDPQIWEFTKLNLPLYVGPGVREWWFTSAHRTEYPPGFAEVVDEVLGQTGAPRDQDEAS